jgi:hypothetical protein
LDSSQLDQGLHCPLANGVCSVLFATLLGISKLSSVYAPPFNNFYLLLPPFLFTCHRLVKK